MTLQNGEVFHDAEVANKAQSLALGALALSVIGLAGALLFHALLGVLAAAGAFLALRALSRLSGITGAGRGIAITALVLGILGTIIAFLTLLGVGLLTHM